MTDSEDGPSATSPAETEPLIVVDAANAVGARPDGWWRDRAGATRRLLTALSQGLTDQGEVVVVLEGTARAAAEPGLVDGVRVVHATRSGDDAIVDVVASAAEADPVRPVTVVTSDRELCERVKSLGAGILGPRSLWAKLE